MEFPNLGKHCSEEFCRQLDFLPFQCSACRKTFCKAHFAFVRHHCTEAYKKNKVVAICPSCKLPLPATVASLKSGEVIRRHLERECAQSAEIRKHESKIYSNKCSLQGCRQKELVPFSCVDCGRNFCVKHRFQDDHRCQATVVMATDFAKPDAACATSLSDTSCSSALKAHRLAASQGEPVMTDAKRSSAAEPHLFEENKNERFSIPTSSSMSSSDDQMTSSRILRDSDKLELEESDLLFAKALQEIIDEDFREQQRKRFMQGISTKA